MLRNFRVRVSAGALDSQLHKGHPRRLRLLVFPPLMKNREENPTAYPILDYLEGDKN